MYNILFFLIACCFLFLRPSEKEIDNEKNLQELEKQLDEEIERATLLFAEPQIAEQRPKTSLDLDVLYYSAPHIIKRIVLAFLPRMKTAHKKKCLTGPKIEQLKNYDSPTLQTILKSDVGVAAAIDGISEKFKINKGQIAFLIDTPAANAWIEKNIVKDPETFKMALLQFIECTDNCNQCFNAGKKFLESGLNPNFVPHLEVSLFTPIIRACMLGNVAMLKLLIDHKVDLESPDNLTEATPLMTATLWENNQAMELLIASKAMVDNTGRGVTALRIAVELTRNIESVRLLLKNNADIFAKAPDNKTPFSVAKKNKTKSPNIARLLELERRNKQN